MDEGPDPNVLGCLHRKVNVILSPGSVSRTRGHSNDHFVNKGTRWGWNICRSRGVTTSFAHMSRNSYHYWTSPLVTLVYRHLGCYRLFSYHCNDLKNRTCWTGTVSTTRWSVPLYLVSSRWQKKKRRRSRTTRTSSHRKSKGSEKKSGRTRARTRG